MTEDELELLHRYLDGAITQEELESLEELLRNNAEARATLRSLATIDAKWQQMAAEEVLGRTDEPTAIAAGDSMPNAHKPAAGTVGSHTTPTADNQSTPSRRFIADILV